MRAKPLPRLAPRTVGLVEIVLSGVGFGLLGVFGKAAFAAGLTAGENLSLRFLLSSALLLAGLAAFDRPALRLGWRTTLRCAALGVFGYAVFSSFFFAALRGLSASLTVLLLYTYPVIVTVLARLAFKQRLSRRNMAALPLVMIGLVCLVSADLSAKDPVYLFYGLGAAVLYSVYILVSSRVLADASPVASVAVIQAFAGLALAAINLHDGPRLVLIVRAAWPILLAMTVLCTAAPMVLFISGLQKLSSPEVSLLSTTEPVTGVALATILLHEQFTGIQWLGAVVIIGALVYMASGKRPAAVVTVAALALALLIAPPADAKPAAAKKHNEKLKKSGLLAPAADPEDLGGNKVGLLFGLGYDAIAFEAVKPAVSLDGFTGSALGTFEVGLGKYGLLQLDGGLHYLTVSGENDTSRLTVASLGLAAEVVPTVVVGESLRFGFLLGYDYGLLGSAEFSSKGEGATTQPMTRSSRLTLGGRFLYQVDTYKAVGFDGGSVSGGYKLKAEKSGAAPPPGITYTGMSLRGLFAYFF